MSPCEEHTNDRGVFGVTSRITCKVWKALSALCLVFGFLVLSEPVSYGDTLGRLSTDETELLMLKRALAEQDRRITALENALGIQQSGVAQVPRGNTAPPPVVGDSPTTDLGFEHCLQLKGSETLICRRIVVGSADRIV